MLVSVFLVVLVLSPPCLVASSSSPFSGPNATQFGFVGLDDSNNLIITSQEDKHVLIGGVNMTDLFLVLDELADAEAQLALVTDAIAVMSNRIAVLEAELSGLVVFCFFVSFLILF